MKSALLSVGFFSLLGFVTLPMAGCENGYEQRQEAVDEYNDDIRDGKNPAEAREELNEDLKDANEEIQDDLKDTAEEIEEDVDDSMDNDLDNDGVPNNRDSAPSNPGQP